MTEKVNHAEMSSFIGRKQNGEKKFVADYLTDGVISNILMTWREKFPAENKIQQGEFWKILGVSEIGSEKLNGPSVVKFLEKKELLKKEKTSKVRVFTIELLPKALEILKGADKEKVDEGKGLAPMELVEIIRSLKEQIKVREEIREGERKVNDMLSKLEARKAKLEKEKGVCLKRMMELLALIKPDDFSGLEAIIKEAFLEKEPE